MDHQRGSHGDPGEQAGQGDQADPHVRKDDTFADRSDWDKYRADDVLPGNAPATNFFARIARGLAAKGVLGQHARLLKQTMANYFKSANKDSTTNITREELLDFKKSLEHSLKEIKAAVERSAKDQKSLIEASTSTNSELMQRGLRRLEEVSQEIKVVVDAGVKSQEATADTAKNIFKLMNELAATLKEAPPSKAGDLLGRLEQLALWPKKVANVYELINEYALLIGLICLIAGLDDKKRGLLDPKLEEALIERFFPNNNPGLFEDMGRRIRDLMFKDFEPVMSVLIEPQPADGPLLSLFMKRSPKQIIMEHELKLRDGAIGVDVKVDSAKHVSSLFSFPGVFGAEYDPKFRLCYPFRDSSITLDAFYENAAVRANLSMHPIHGDPLLSLSGLFGTKAFNLGGRMEVDAGNVLRNTYAVGGSMSSSAFTAGLQYNNRDQLLVMVSHKLQEKSHFKELMHRSTIGKDVYTLFCPPPTSQTTIAAQLIHCSTARSTVAAVGIEFMDPDSVLKLRLASSGVVSTSWKSRFGLATVGLKAQFDVTNLGAGPRVGFSVCIQE